MNKNIKFLIGSIFCGAMLFSSSVMAADIACGCEDKKEECPHKKVAVQHKHHDAQVAVGHESHKHHKKHEKGHKCKCHDKDHKHEHMHQHDDHEYDNKRFMLRARAIRVAPKVTTTYSSVNYNASVSHATTPEVDLSYFFNEHVAAELIAGTTRHVVNLYNGSSGKISVGNVKLLPPILSLQYHFKLGDVMKPYGGVGLNYTHFYGVKKSATFSSVKYKDNWGYALQAGMDIPVSKNFGVNVDAKKLFLNTKVTTTSVDATVKVKLNPWIVSSGLYVRF